MAMVPRIIRVTPRSISSYPKEEQAAKLQERVVKKELGIMAFEDLPFLNRSFLMKRIQFRYMSFISKA
jgi:hypothetical protein